MGNFASQVAGFAQRAAASTDQAVKAVERALFAEVIRGSPIDSGALISSWLTSTDSPADGVREPFAPGSKGSTREANVDAAIADMTDKVGGAGKVTYLVNNQPYAYGLEFGTHSYGFSQQAPAGMVRINAVRFAQIVEETVGALR